jgi:hypothetical protein
MITNRDHLELHNGLKRIEGQARHNSLSCKGGLWTTPGPTKCKTIFHNRGFFLTKDVLKLTSDMTLLPCI